MTPLGMSRPITSLPGRPITSLPARPITGLAARPITSLPGRSITSLPARPITHIPGNNRYIANPGNTRTLAQGHQPHGGQDSSSSRLQTITSVPTTITDASLRMLAYQLTAGLPKEVSDNKLMSIYNANKSSGLDINTIREAALARGSVIFKKP